MTVNPAPDSVTGPFVLYDADCGFCRWSLAKVLAWDRRRALRPVAIDSPAGGRLLAGLGDSERERTWHLVLDGRRYSAGAALPPLLRLLPAGNPLAALAARAPRAADAAYRFVAGRRALFGRLVTAGAKRRADARISSRSA
jgi:predicted DCC family thiol-disulfide oxidoreductase YuxK